MWNSIRAAALAIAFAAAAYGQHGTTKNLRITLTNDPACRSVNRVSVVMDDDDRNAIAATKDASVPCRWVFESPFGTFNTKITHFSLRLGLARTRCGQSSFDSQSRRADLKFRCCEKGPVRQMTVEIDPPASVDYAREVGGSLPCVERGTVPETLTDVQPSVEKLRLQLLPQRPPGCGVVVNDLITSARPGAAVTLTAAKAAEALAKQANLGGDCRPPGFSGAAIDVFNETLALQAPKSIVLKVQ